MRGFYEADSLLWIKTASERIYSHVISVCNACSHTRVCSYVIQVYKSSSGLQGMTRVIFFLVSLCHAQYWGSRAFFFIADIWVYQLLAIYLLSLSSWHLISHSQFFAPFLEFVITKISHWIINPAEVEFFILQQKPAERKIGRIFSSPWGGNMATLHASTGSRMSFKQIPRCTSRFFPFLFLWILFHFLYVCPAWKCSFVAGRVLTACLSSNSLCALGLSQTPLTFSFLFFPLRLLVCLPLYSWRAGCCLWADSSIEILEGGRAKRVYKGRYDAVSRISCGDIHIDAENSSLQQTVQI